MRAPTTATRILGLATAAAAGAGLMYYFDRDAGRRRRSRIRDRSTHLLHELNDGIDRTRRDVQHRTTGVVQRTRSRLQHEPVSDHVLHERVRAEIGRCVSHPRSIEVAVEDGQVTLRGPILQREVGRLLACVEAVPGVHGVVPRLEPHKTAENVPGLQGRPARARRGRRPDLLQESWAPATRLVTTLLGVGSGLRARRHRGVLGPVYGLLGTGLALRGLTNLPMNRLLGLGLGRRAIELQKTLTVNAPVEEVFRFWSNIENFPRFMQHIQRVERIDDTRSRWTVDGPAGTDVTFEAETTRVVPNRSFAWKTLPGAQVEHAGRIQFQPANGRATRLQIRFAYNPPAGAVGHAVAKLFGKDPKTAMDEDLVRMKSLLERGKTAAHGQTVTRDQLPVR